MTTDTITIPTLDPLPTVAFERGVDWKTING